VSGYFLGVFPSAGLLPRHAVFFQQSSKGGRPLLLGQTYVDELSVVTLLEIVQDRGVVKVCQVGHILSLLILGRVHLLQQVLLQGLLLLVRVNNPEINDNSLIAH